MTVQTWPLPADTGFGISGFAETGDLGGHWSERHETRFVHSRDPLAVKFIVEKLTATLLTREPPVEGATTLVYAGRSEGSPDPREVRLVFEAAAGAQGRYALSVQRIARCAWVGEAEFLREGQRLFALWCLKLGVGHLMTAPADAALFATVVRDTITAEDKAAAPIVDSARITALQAQVVRALREGLHIIARSEDGSTRFHYDGESFVRTDRAGNAPPVAERCAGGVQLLVLLRKFFDWESRRT